MDLTAERIWFPPISEDATCDYRAGSLSLCSAGESQSTANEILTTAPVCRIKRQVHSTFPSVQLFNTVSLKD